MSHALNHHFSAERTLVYHNLILDFRQCMDEANGVTVSDIVSALRETMPVENLVALRKGLYHSTKHYNV